MKNEITIKTMNYDFFCLIDSHVFSCKNKIDAIYRFMYFDMPMEI